MPLWTLDQALEVIRALQPLARELEYHITLGGGVLNAGTSEKDADLFFLKLNGFDPEPGKLMELLVGVFGPLTALRDAPDYHEGALSHYREMFRGAYLGARVDLFVQ